MASLGAAQPAPPPPLPANITREQIQQTYINFQNMKKNGVPETDPEFLKAHNLLKAVQQHTAYAKQRQDYQRAQRVQQSGQQSPTNGEAMSTPSNGTRQELEAQQSPATNGNGSVTTPTQASGRPAEPMTQEQKNLLRTQIMAFKHLTKNIPLPANIRQTLFGSQMVKKDSTPAPPSSSAQAPSQATTGPVAETATAVSTYDGAPPREPFLTFDDPYKLIKQSIGYTEHNFRAHRPQVPTIIPLGVDMNRLMEERNIILYNRLQSRRTELENMHANIATWNSGRISGQEDDSIKRKALIEYKKLCLLEKQRALRKHISREMLNADNLAMTANRTLYRRVKKQSLREARITEKLEKQQRDARESKEKKKHVDFLNSIVQQVDKMRTAAFTQHQRYAKLGRAVQSQHVHLEKEEQKRIERTAKQRLQALKANDEETYLKLLDQAKDTRISHLLRQTDGFLNQLAASVKEQQRGAVARYGNREPEPVEEEIYESDEEESGASKKASVDYFEVAHRIKEEVVAQSTNLVGGTLKEYQIKGLQWMLSLYNNNLNGILADEMGLGKTIQTISLITYLIEKKKEAGPYLVIVPLSTLTNWNNEFDKWAPSITKIVYKGPPNARKQHANQIRWGQFQVLLTTYEFIIKDRPILAKIKWLHMIVDEGHRMKNAQSKLSSTITQYYTTRYRIILTGTPLQNSLPELWALLNFVLPNIFKSVKSFDEWFNTPFANTGGQDKMELTEEEQLLVIRRLHKVLRPFLLRRLKKDVEKDLPDKTERVIKCGFSSLQAKLYKQLVNHQKLLVSDGKGGKTGMRGLSNMLMQLRKLCNHPFVFEEVEDQVNPGRTSNDLLWRTAGKFELLDRVLPKFQATNHRVLMFFQMTQIMNIMEDFMRLRGIKYLRLDGSTKADDRSELLRLFNAPGSEYFCFLLSTRAGGLGLNLQTADTVIIYDSDWNPHQDLQAQDRAHRIGQKNEVRILRLITSNSVEEKILERANYKLDMDGKVIQAGKFDNKSTENERDAMLRIMLESAEDAAELEADQEQDDDDLNVIMMRSEDELKLFQKMDEERLRTSKYGPNKKLPRLLSESELPDIYVNDDQPIVEEIEENLGRGARDRTRVKYDDGLTEEQWLEAVDNDEDTIEEAIARKEARVARKAGKESRGTPVPSRESSESPAPKKRGRKPVPKAEKRKIDEVSVNGDTAPPAKRGRPNRKVNLTPEQRDVLQLVLDSVYDPLVDVKDRDGRELAGPFLELPPRADYPDYYQFIKKPICFNDIADKINEKKYQNLKEFRQDIKLLCDNCRQYNEDGSILWKDANSIEEYALKLMREETEAYPDLQDFDDAASGRDGASAGPVSSRGTPMPGRTY
ncbi:hypothetical protein BLS_009658 [Venturia inaequalis]|uniref:Uncharacterized protein n=1 Tax=Venturia inaequalis TaxID=5025 RepID=A0A8H3Z449_VENIN|nr:hypothetical protein EG328_009622 [Venturia inaequalis]KAE9985180.1 hypothetical protein BLS_009658 [Venturia inaequalis]KAE9993205.1 hypothetical protein EG327_006006 [Venturia inaequalis]RDI86611.1 hypothetical protein Vi05172_g3551 [Venturia inaequalis]